LPTSPPPSPGDLSRKITSDVRGEILELKDTGEPMVTSCARRGEVTRGPEVRHRGQTRGQADVKDVAGYLEGSHRLVNFMAGNLTAQVRNIADVTQGRRAGDLSRKITVDVRGEILDLRTPSTACGPAAFVRGPR